MNNKMKRVSMKTAVSVVSIPLGGLHLLFKTAADVTVKTEVKLLHKLTGVPKRELTALRLNKTRETQLKVADLATRPFKEIPAKMQEFINNHKIKQDVKQTV